MAAALIATSTGAGMAQDVAKGEISFKKCVVCHSIGPGAQNKVGPGTEWPGRPQGRQRAALPIFRCQQEFGHRLE